MAHRDSSHRRHRTTQSIPLQDLARPPEETEHSGADGRHRRITSDGGRRLFSGNPARRLVESAQRGSYAPLGDYQDHNTHEHPHNFNEVESDPSSPLVDGSSFQAALGFAGIDLGDREDVQPMMSASALPARADGLGTMTGVDDSFILIDNFGFDEDDGQSPPMETFDDEDTAPLTENTLPMGRNEPSVSSGQRHDRISTPTVRFGLVDPPSPARLGDDLATVEREVGRSTSTVNRAGSRMRSLSPSSAASPLKRASTMVRKVSQRVVNLSNEPEIAEQSIRRRQSSRIPNVSRSSHVEDTAYNHDGATSPAEKITMSHTPVRDNWVAWRNPLKGRSLGIFPPDNPLRTKLCDLLVRPATEAIILLLILVQAVLVAVDASKSVYSLEYAYNDLRNRQWSSPIDYALLALFSVYTIEIMVKVIVSGFVINPVEYSTIDRGIGLRAAFLNWFKGLFAVQPDETLSSTTTPATPGPSILRSFTANTINPDYSAGSRQQARMRLAHRAFLRHSFNRLDFLAVVAYWISFVLSLFDLEGKHHFYLFHMMSSLRILRLLSLTSGTSIILRSLKKAAPLLLNVALLIGFFWLVFGIIGVQIFKSSLRRHCVWEDPAGDAQYKNIFQFCGGSLLSNGTAIPWVRESGSYALRHKGYLCPPNSRCLESTNPYEGTVSFDNIAQSLELVFVLMTSNTYSDLMYYLTDSDYLFAALYFAGGTIVMTFWLVNLLIAVITTSFQVIREQSKTSAFANQSSDEPIPDLDENDLRKNRLRDLYDRTSWLWIAVIVYGLICQCLRSAEMSQNRRRFIDYSEIAVTLILILEIILRFLVDIRHFFDRRRNWVDLGLAIITGVIQIPLIPNVRDGDPYAWLTIFQILRVYRVVLAVPFTKNLIVLIVGNVTGLLNLILFVFLLTFFGALFASQLLRGELPQEQNGDKLNVTFATIYNSFLGMYQILSSENWTSILYSVTSASVRWDTAWINAMFIILWFILAFFVVLNMFIAVIQENFDVSEDEKRVQQVRAYLQQRELGASSNATLSLSAMFKLRELGGRRQDPLDYGQAMMDQLLKPDVAQKFLDEDAQITPAQTPATSGPRPRPSSTIIHTGPFGYLRNKMARFMNSEPNPFYSRLKFSKADEAMDARAMAQEVAAASKARKKAQLEYLAKYPTYNVSLYLFEPRSHFRRFCQRIVGPGRGSERIQGAAPTPIIFFAFSAVLYLAIVGMVILACITTPLYQRRYILGEGHMVSQSWFLWADLGFAILFTVEGAIRVVADGFFFTPHAYLRSSWGIIDGVVLLTLWINVIATFRYDGDVSRAVGAFKALRALRLLNISDSARDTFHSVIVRGGWKVLSAAFVSLSLLIPFAIYGLNLFNGKLISCNDGNLASGAHLANCVDEYNSSPFDWDVLAPRQAANPWFDFDNFGNSLLILFSIVSQEGWVNVMWSAASITGVYQQPGQSSSLGYTVFFVIFNLLGTVFVLTLFVSVFMRNYTEQTGVAFLTAEQRSWLELRKLLRQIAPSKRPVSSQKRSAIRAWCYNLAKAKTGRWQRFVTVVLTFHLGLLCVDFSPAPPGWDEARTYTFLVLTIFYIANIAIRITGLSWTRFRKNSWDLYALLTVSGTFVFSVLYLATPATAGTGQLHTVWEQLHKIFLVAVILLLIPRNNQLDQLLKTAAASLTAIANLLATWFVLFLVYAIAFTQTFGLTRFNDNESGNINFRNVPKALILLYRCSTGEGWNQLMEDFANVRSPFCTQSERFLAGDCGSAGWSRALFISWNILSMYIFVNMFVSLIFESFSYVYQRSSGLAAIKRQDIRKFKQAWAEYDPNGTGYITQQQFPRLLAELSGIFEMRIYDKEWSISNIIEDSKKSRRQSELPVEESRRSTDIDTHRLNARLERMPVKEIRNRRRRLNVFYEEVLNSSDVDRGISFESLLMILAHYKVINDNKSLRLEEFLRRRARLQLVEDSVRRSIVANFMDMVYWSRKWRQHKAKKDAGRMTTVPTLQVPEIFVEDEDDLLSPTADPTRQHKPSLSLQIPTVGSPSGVHASSRNAVDTAGSHLRNRSESIQNTPSSPSWARQISPTRSSFDSRPSMSSHDLNEPPSPVRDETAEEARQARSRGTSNVSAMSVADAFESSAWGESLARRSTTLRRGGAGRRSAGSAHWHSRDTSGQS